MFVRSLDEALRLIVEYGLSAPRAFVTVRDEVILDVCEGRLEFPDDAATIYEGYKARFPSWIGSWTEPDDLGKWVRSRCAKLNHAAKEYAAATGFDGSTPDANDHKLNRLERELQSVAAKYGLNLFDFGFQVPGVVCAELERLEPDMPAGEGECSDNLDAGMQSDPLVVRDPAEPFLSDATPLTKTLSNIPPNDCVVRKYNARYFSSKYMIEVILAKPMFSVIIFVLVLWVITGGDLDSILSRLFMIIMYSSMVAFALVFYKVLDALVWGEPSSKTQEEIAFPTDEFNLQNWRNGRVPRYMDETDPASGPEWVGNRQHAEQLKSDAARRNH